MHVRSVRIWKPRILALDCVVSGKRPLFRVAHVACKHYRCVVVSQVHPEGVQQQNERPEVAGWTPDVGGLGKCRSIAQFLLHTRRSGEDPRHRCARATPEIATTDAWHILAAGRCHARKFGIKFHVKRSTMWRTRHVAQLNGCRQAKMRYPLPSRTNEFLARSK